MDFPSTSPVRSNSSLLFNGSLAIGTAPVTSLFAVWSTMALIPMRYIVGTLIVMSQLHAEQATKLLELLRAKAERVQSFTARVTLEVAIPSFHVPPAHGIVTAILPDSIRFESDQLTFIPKGGWQLNPLVLLQRHQFIAIAGEQAPKGMTTLRLFPSDESNDILAAKLTVDLRDTTVTSAEIITRTSGTIQLDMTYGKFRSLLLPDRIILHLRVPTIALPKALTGDIAPSSTTMRKPPAKELVQGTITVRFLEYTAVGQRNFMRH